MSATGKNTRCEVGFGPHLTLDLYGCKKEKLNDLDFITDFLDKFPEQIGMTKISPPSVTPFPGNDHNFDKGGVSAFVLITESHISIHTFGAQEFASVDIFSCKPFDLQKAEEYVTKILEAKKVEKNLIMRGQEFPRDIPASAQIVNTERKIFFKKSRI